MTIASALLLVSALAPSAVAADPVISVGLAGGGIFTDQLEILDNSVVITPRVGYWFNPTLGLELDLNLIPAGRTRVGQPDPSPYFGVLPAANLVGRVFADEPVNLLLNVGMGPFFKKVSDDGTLGLPTGEKVDVDFAGISGPGLMVPLGDLALRADVRWLLNIGTESYQNRGDTFIDTVATLGLQWLPIGPRDADKDGVADDVDECPNEPEDIDEFEDGDGCPDPDNDGDGIADIDDSCQGEAEDFDSFEDTDGCPDLDNDGDGITDVNDACPDEAGIQAMKGCPDADGDGLVDGEDECPDEAGEHAAFGCPDNDGDHVPNYRDDCPEDAAPTFIDARKSDGCVKIAYITRDSIKITDKVYFLSGKSTIQRKSHAVLDAVASILEKFDGIKRTEVQGHTDSSGNDDYNLALSQSRADAVVAYLVEKREIAAERLQSKGYGETKPIGDNATRAGKETNRRVEFVITEQETAVKRVVRPRKANDKADKAMDKAESAMDKAVDKVADAVEEADSGSDKAADKAEKAMDTVDELKEEAEDAKDKAEDAKDKAEDAKDKVDEMTDKVE